MTHLGGTQSYQVHPPHIWYLIKGAVWGTLIGFVVYEQAHFWYGSANLNQIRINVSNQHHSIGLEIIVYHSLSFSADDMVEIVAKKSKAVPIANEERVSKQSAGIAKAVTTVTTTMTSNAVN